jgi:FkbM family methyltransferase
MTLGGSLKRVLARSVPEPIWKRMLQRYYFTRVKGYRQANEWESGERDLGVVKHLVASGDSVIDVGANFGFYTVYLSGLVGHGGSVSSFEPIPLTFDILAYNTRNLSLANVKVFNCAISDQGCSAIMNVPRFKSGSDNYYQARLARAGSDSVDSTGRQIAVQVKTLDSIFNGLSKRVTFIKMDVEGHELQAIRGAKDIIRSFKPALLIEMSGDLDDNQSAAFALLSQLQNEGYLPYWYDGTRLRLRSRGDTSVNYFFLTDEQLRHLDTSVRRDPAERDAASPRSHRSSGGNESGR